MNKVCQLQSSCGSSATVSQIPVPLMIMKDVVVTARGKKIIEIDHWQINGPGVTAVLGPSGCGKSTLIRVLSGIFSPQIHVNGSLIQGGEASHHAASELRCSMVWQTPTVFPCSVFDNLKLPLKADKVDKAQWPVLMEDALLKVGLLTELGSDWRKVNAATLSGGQKQRLCIATNLLMQSDVILLDEATASLDPISTAKIEDIIREISREKLVIMITHNIGQARRLADYAALFCFNPQGFGFLCEAGKAAEVLFNPSQSDSRKYIQLETGS
jgi:phosphate transport system ATP-binding protein